MVQDPDSRVKGPEFRVHGPGSMVDVRIQDQGSWVWVQGEGKGSGSSGVQGLRSGVWGPRSGE